jgi:hypothetical protein
MRGEAGPSLQWLEWLMELLLSLILVRHCSLLVPLSNPQLQMTDNFEEVMCAQFYSKLDVPYSTQSAFSVVIQW